MANPIALKVPTVYEGPFSGLKYLTEVVLDLSQNVTRILDLTRLTYKILSEKEGETSHQGHVVWHGIETISTEVLRNILSDYTEGESSDTLSSNHLFTFLIEEVGAQPPSIRMNFYLKPAAIRQISQKAKLFERVDNVNTLAKFIVDSKPEEEPLIQKTLEQMVDEFFRHSNLTKAQLKEILTIYPFLNNEQKKLVLTKFSDSLNAMVQNTSLVEGFTTIFEEELHLYTSSLVQDVVSKQKNARPFLIDPSEILELAIAIGRKLEQNFLQSSDENLIARNLRALAVLTKALLAIDARKMREDDYKSLLGTLKRFKDHKNLTISTTSRFALNSIVVIGHDKSKNQQVVERGGHLVLGIANILNAVKNVDLLPLVDAVSHFKKAFALIDGLEDWFLPYIVLEDLVLRETEGKYLPKLLEVLQSDRLKELIGGQNSHNQYYVSGVVAICRDVILKFSPHADTAIKILDLIIQNNRKDAKRCDLTLNDKEAQHQILRDMFSLLYKLTFHPNENIRAASRLSLGDLEISLNEWGVRPKILADSDLFPTNSFENFFLSKAMAQEELKWQPKLRLWRDRFLATRTVNERTFYYPLTVKNSESPQEEISIFVALKKFLKSKSRVLVILGSAGSGKTISMINYVVGVWNQENDHVSEGYVPIFVPLGKAEKPFENVFSGVLDQDTLDSLRRRKVLGVFDGFDEGHAKISGSRVPNLLQKNDLSSWENGKWVVTLRSDQGVLARLNDGSLNLEHFFLDGVRPDVVTIQPVSRRKFIEQSFPRLSRRKSVSARPLTPSDEAWTPERLNKFLDTVDKKLNRDKGDGDFDKSDFLSNPFFLTVLAQNLPNLFDGIKDPEKATISGTTVLTEVVRSNIERHRMKPGINFPKIKMYFVSLVIAQLMKEDSNGALPDPRLDENRTTLERINNAMRKGREFLWEANAEVLTRDEISEAISCIQVEGDATGKNLVYKHPIYQDFFNTLSDTSDMALMVGKKIDASFKGIKPSQPKAGASSSKK